MRTFIRKIIGTFLQLLPAGTPEFLYATFFRGPLGLVVNPLIMALLPKEARIPEGVIVLNPKDPAVSGAVAFGVYESFEAQLFRESVAPGMVVVDIGANIGYYTVIAAGRTGQSGRVIAFEPEPENFAILQRTILANKFQNAEAHQVAIADATGTLVLNLFESNKGRHSLVKDKRDAKGFTTFIRVPAITLDSFLSEHGISRVDVIKMDIEGAESLAFQGMHHALARAKMIFFECTPDSVRKVGHDPVSMLTLLRSSGFTLYEIDEHAKSIQPIQDLAQCVNGIRRGECANFFCVKQKMLT